MYRVATAPEWARRLMAWSRITLAIAPGFVMIVLIGVIATRW